MEINSEVRQMLLDLHRSEFEIQSTRITYWITLQYASYTIAAIGLGFLVQMFSTIQLLTLALTATLLGQVFVLAMIHVNQEMFANVAYIQQRLKPRVNHLLGDSYEFWEFEDLQANDRRTQKLAGFEAHYVLPVIFGLVVGIGLVSIIWSSVTTLNAWKKVHFFWLFCNCCVLLMVIAKLPSFLRLQQGVLGGYGRFALREPDKNEAISPERKDAANGAQ